MTSVRQRLRLRTLESILVEPPDVKKCVREGQDCRSGCVDGTFSGSAALAQDQRGLENVLGQKTPVCKQ